MKILPGVKLNHFSQSAIYNACACGGGGGGSAAIAAAMVVAASPPSSSKASIFRTISMYASFACIAVISNDSTATVEIVRGQGINAGQYVHSANTPAWPVGQRVGRFVAVQ